MCNESDPNVGIGPRLGTGPQSESNVVNLWEIKFRTRGSNSFHFHLCPYFQWGSTNNPIALRTAKTLRSFGCFECNRVEE